MIFGLGGTTPLPRWLLGRAYEILTFERFTFWATLLAMPLVGVLQLSCWTASAPRRRFALSLAAVGTVGAGARWFQNGNLYRPAVDEWFSPVICLQILMP